MGVDLRSVGECRASCQALFVVLLSLATDPLWAESANLLANPDFDVDFAGWVIDVSGGSLPYEYIDADRCPNSSSLGATAVSSGFDAPYVSIVSGCVNVSENVVLHQELAFDGSWVSLGFHQYALSDCAGAIDYELTEPSPEPGPGLMWVVRKTTAVGPQVGVTSVKFVAVVWGGAGLPLAARIDRAYLGLAERIMVADFEEGAACRWGPDVTPPTTPGPLTSPSHPTGVPTQDSTIYVYWVESTDLYTRVENYRIEINGEADPPACADLLQSLPAPSSGAFAEGVPPGSYYTHLCAQDTMGAMSGVASLGPLIVID